jgi:hypothetical protein
MNKSVSHRRKLNTEQVLILELLYAFRFGNNDLIAQYFGKKDRSFVFRRLSILQEHGLIGKRFEPSYRLRGRPAAYYLLPDGARALKQYRDEDDTDEVNIKAIYKDSTVSEKFIDHCFAVFRLYILLSEEYGDDMDLFTKTDQGASFDDLPEPPPDAYVTLQGDGNTRHYFIDVLDDDTHLIIDASKKIKRYIEYRKSGNWALMKVPFPMIILVCNSEEACKRVQKRCDYLLGKAWVTDISFTATTSMAIKLS